MEFVKKIKGFVGYLSKTHMFDRSAQVTFYLVLALFPVLYVTIRATAIFSVSNDTINEMLYFLFPNEGYALVIHELKSLAGETWQTIVSTGIAIWSASMVMNSIKSAITLDHIPQRRNVVIDKIISLIMTILLGVGILVSLLIIMALNFLTGFIWEYLGIYEYPRVLTMVPAAVIFLIDLVMVYMMVPVNKIRMTDALPGAIVAEILFIVAFWVFSYYVGSVANYSLVYGAMSSVIVLLMWLYICCCILVFGGHLNAYIQEQKEQLIGENE